MRIELKTSPLKGHLERDHYEMIKHSISRWLGPEARYGQASNFSFSLIRNGKVSGTHGKLEFPYGGNLFFSSYEKAPIKTLMYNLQQDNRFVDKRLEVTDIRFLSEPNFRGDRSNFLCYTPILIKAERMLSYDNPESDQVLTRSCRARLAKVGLPYEDLEVKFDRHYPRPKVFWVRYRKVNNLVNVCPITIKGYPEARRYLYHAGMGHSTGIGFGFIG